jgi:hypothetical protein
MIDLWTRTAQDNALRRFQFAFEKFWLFWYNIARFVDRGKTPCTSSERRARPDTGRMCELSTNSMAKAALEK